ncbi:MAG: dihydroorotase [Deltaproteobacteria bacterium]|nr:dihydroorotase [Deltaproteobacteria bacterium]
MRTLIANSRVIDPASGLDEPRDILIEDGRILDLVRPGETVADVAERIDATGRISTPGFVDLHVHLREPGYEQKETIATGCMAAVSGGFTSVCSMANTNPVNDHSSVTALILAKAKEANLARVFPMAAVTKGLAGESLTEMGELYEHGVVGFTDDGRCVMNAAVMRSALVYAKSFGVPVSVHAIDEHLAGDAPMHSGFHSMRLGLRGVPSAAEDTMVARDVVLSALTGARLHVQHISTKGAIEIVRMAKARGVPVTCEAAPHHFTLIDEDVGEYDTNFKMAPPLRGEVDREAVREALADGTIDAIATDHAPHEMLVKDCEFEKAANGIIGLETALSLTWDLVEAGVISEMRAIELLTIAPCKAFNLPHGTLAKGAAADVAIFDPKATYTFTTDRIYSLSKNSPFIGRAMKADVKRTLVGGRTVFART